MIVEYKDPDTLSADRDAASNKKLLEQLKKRFYDFRREENRQWGSMFGVGTDGKYFVFLRFRDDKWTDLEPLEVNRYSTERFLWALYNLGQKGKPYQPDYLHGDFGSDSSIGQEGVRTLYQEILDTENPRAQVFFSQWKILFGEVCGYDVENLSDKLKKLAEFYAVGNKPEPAPLLFALHTYYAILIKLLAAEIVSFFNPWMPRQVEKLLNATTSAKLKRELEELERGGIFHTMGITNFLEGDLFSWYLAVWSVPVEKLMRQMIVKLDEYNSGTFSEDPAQSRDLLKKLYQQLFPKSVRHDLGEYYTPDWLAEHVLNELGYEGDPDKRLLDPACGSGTFLVMAINRIRRWYDANRERCAYDEGDLLKKILANVIGFDLNPLAVMAARTNYLVAVKDLIRHVEHVEIPVYLCDSIMTPAEYGDLFTGGTGNVARVPCSAMKPPHLLVPKEIAKSPKEVAKYAEVLETSIKNAYAPQEFLTRCKDEGLNITATDAHIGLYKELVRLDKENKNGIWARIIKNNFAPLFVGKVDFVAGNPPWINWDALPSGYRQDTAKLWQTYRLFPHQGLRARLGSAEDDISILLTYVAMDHYLNLGRTLGFVITQTVFQSKGGGQGFRRFRLNGHPSKVERVSDFTSFQPFEDASNKTATVVVLKGKETRYPIGYTRWSKTSNSSLDSSFTWEQASKNLQPTACRAKPIGDVTSPWIISTVKLLPLVDKISGASSYRARLGVYSSPTAVFWVRILAKRGRNLVLIENEKDAGKQKVEIQFQGPVESTCIWPLARGRDLERWICHPSKHIILAHDPTEGDKALSPAELKQTMPKLLGYFKAFEKVLRARKNFQKYFDTSSAPFWSMFNVGPYTFARFKVAWRYVDSGFRCAVLSTVEDPHLGEKMVVPDGKLVIIPFEDCKAAHFVCAVLNSSPAQFVITNYVVSTQIATHITQHIAIPQWSPHEALHRELAELSMQCHAVALSGKTKQLAPLQKAIDVGASKLWNLSKDELDDLKK